MQVTEIKLNTILCGKSEEKLKEFPDNFFDGIVTDPPYGLNFMGKEWDTFFETKKIRSKTPGDRGVLHYDLSLNGQRHFQSYFYKIAVEMLRTAKPGSFLLCFGGTRTYHRVVCAIEDAGWLIRDQMMWIYGEGFPKSTNISKQLDKEAGIEPIGKIPAYGGLKMRADVGWHSLNNALVMPELQTSDAKRWDGYGTGLKPGWEPIIVAMKPLEQGLTYAQNAKKWNVAGLNIDGGRIGTETMSNHGGKTSGNVYGGGNGIPPIPVGSYINKGRWPSNVILNHSPDCVCVGTKQVGNGEYKKHTVEDAKASWKNSSKNIETIAYGQEIVEVYACVSDCPIRIMDGQSGAMKSSGNRDGTILKECKNSSFNSSKEIAHKDYNDSGGASRFFYCAKAKRSEKEAGLIGFAECVKCGKFNSKEHTIIVDGEKKKEKCTRNNHPTVKPLDLMKYLLNLIKMPSFKENKQVILDPFCGSGSTLVAAEQLGINYIGIDQNSDSCLTSIGRIGG